MLTLDARRGVDRLADVVDQHRRGVRRRVVLADDVGDVVVDPLAHEDDRLAPAAHAARTTRRSPSASASSTARCRRAPARRDRRSATAADAAPRCRKYCSLRATVAETSFRPMNLSTDARSSRLLLVNSCAASVRPPVWTTAIRSLAPRLRSMNWRIAIFTRSRCGARRCAGRRGSRRRRGRRTAAR